MFECQRAVGGMPFGEVARHALLVRMRLWSVRSHSKARVGHAERGATACHHLSHSETHPLHVSEHSVSCSSPSGGAGLHYPTLTPMSSDGLCRMESQYYSYIFKLVKVHLIKDLKL